MSQLDDLKRAITRHAHEGLTQTAIPGLSVVSIPNVTAAVFELVEPTLAVIAQGAKQTSLNGRTFSYGPGQFVVVTVDLPVTAYVTRASSEEPFLAAVFELRPATIAALLLETTQVAPRAHSSNAAQPGIAVSDASPALLDATTRLLALLDTPEDAAALASGIEREILWRLITGPQGAMVRQIGTADSRLTHLARSIQWIRDHHRQTLHVADLAALASMSVSSFHRHFRAVTAMTPVQFQKQLRLQEARTRLLAEPGHVADIGFTVGYDSPSQFSREYRRMFGISPSQEGSLLANPSAEIDSRVSG